MSPAHATSDPSESDTAAAPWWKVSGRPDLTLEAIRAARGSPLANDESQLETVASSWPLR